MYIANWQEFQEAAEALYERSPTNVSLVIILKAHPDMTTQARYCVKWRASEGVLVLKITDNTTV